MRRGFTVTEVLVATGIMLALAAILIPVYARAREAGNRAGCLTNLKGIGTAMTLYLADADDRAPASRSGFFGGRFTTGVAWAGRLAPYAGGSGVFRCRSDRREVPASAVLPGGVPVTVTLPGAETVSYGLNANLVGDAGVASATSAARTVLLLKVTGGRALLTLPDEGASLRPGTDRLVSPEGDGTNGGLFAEARPRPDTTGLFTLYATGEMDNANGPLRLASETGEARHGAGTNFLALDGHAAWSPPKRVSAGRSARAPNDAQTDRGCRHYAQETASFPCAEGTAQGGHRLTFSAR